MLTQFSKTYRRILLKNAFILLLLSLLIAAVLLHWIDGMNLYIAVFGFFVTMAALKYIENRKLLHSSTYLMGFRHLPHLSAYEETLPKIFFPAQHRGHAVLLIHGFSASSHEFRFLCEALQKKNIGYYAPTLTGFGLDNMEKLKNVSIADWQRDVRAAYDILSAAFDRVSIVSHSMGAMLALLLLREMPASHLVLTGPYVREKDHHSIFKFILSRPFTAAILKFINPVVKKNDRAELEQLKNSGRFVYTSVPVEAIQRLWELVDTVDYKVGNAETLTIFFGEKDKTIDTADIVRRFGEQNPGCAIHSFPRSGHNILEDAEHEEVVRKILDVLHAGQGTESPEQ